MCGLVGPRPHCTGPGVAELPKDQGDGEPSGFLVDGVCGGGELGVTI